MDNTALVDIALQELQVSIDVLQHDAGTHDAGIIKIKEGMRDILRMAVACKFITVYESNLKEEIYSL